MSEKLLVVGGGGREHALTWKLAQSGDVGEIFVTPGNAGTQKETKVKNIDLDVTNQNLLMEFCKQQEIDLVIVGPEAPLALGISNMLTENNIHCFGPTKESAQIESSKLFSKMFMDKHNIPTASWKHFNKFESACSFINDCNFDGIVVKVSGLAYGKGVYVTTSKEQAKEKVYAIMKVKKV